MSRKICRRQAGRPVNIPLACKIENVIAVSFCFYSCDCSSHLRQKQNKNLQVGTNNCIWLHAYYYNKSCFQSIIIVQCGKRDLHDFKHFCLLNLFLILTNEFEFLKWFTFCAACDLCWFFRFYYYSVCFNMVQTLYIEV